MGEAASRRSDGTGEMDPALAEIVRRLVEAYQPERIYLFGSRARGDAGPDSDYDLLVIEQDPVEDWWMAEEAIREALADLELPLDIHVMGEAEYLETRRVPGSLAYPVAQMGVVLYERSRAGEKGADRSVDRIGGAGLPSRGAGPRR